jgi:hypothetical protein
MDDKTIFEKTVLQIIKDGNGEYGWYNIAGRLSNLDVPRSIDLMECLRDLEKRSLARTLPKEEMPHGVWELTEQGNIFLAQLRE